MKFFWTYLFLLFSVSSFWAQAPIFNHLTEKDGLPDIEFYGVIEDRDGFIWFAADKGLYRYDGKEFKNYTHPDKRGLSVFGLQLDDQGRLWCNNISGQYFYVENDELHLFTDLKEYTRGQLGEYFFNNNELVVNGNSSIFFIDLISKKIRIPKKENNIFEEVYKKSDTTFFIDKDKVKFFNSYGKIDTKAKLDWNMPFIVHKGYGWNSFQFKDVAFLNANIYETGKSIIFALGPNKTNDVVAPILEMDHNMSDYYVDGDFLWLATSDGLLGFVYEKGKLIRKKIYFEGDWITSIIKDRNENYWVTTLRKGVYVLPNLSIVNHHIEKEYGSISTLCKENDSTLLLGSMKGLLSEINVNNGTHKKIFHKEGDRIFKVVKDFNKTYISYARESAYLNNNRKVVYGVSSSFTSAKDLSILNEDDVVYASFAYSSIRRVIDKSFRRLRGQRAYTSHYSKLQNEIFVGYVDGFYYHNYASGINPSEIKFNEQSIFAIDIDETLDGMIWVSTFKDGIIGIKNNKVVVNYNTENGLLSNQTGVIKSDGQFLWIVTNKSLQQLDTETGEFRNLTKKDGINSFIISDIAVFDDVIFISSNEGLIELDKKEVFKKQFLADFYFTNILIEDQSVSFKNNYELSPSENKIQFQFHTNGYQINNNLDYYYRLLGASDNWNKISRSTNEVTFNNLSAGNYTFELKSSEINSSSSSPAQSIKIKVNAPFYEQLWFLILFFLALLTAIWLYFLRRMRKLKVRQKETLEKERITRSLVSSQLENLRSQMNPHFIFNALNSIQEYIVLNEKHLASEYLVKFSRLIRIYLEHSQKHYIPLSEEIKALELYLELEKDRFEDTLEYSINVSKELQLDTLEVPSIFIQPYIENGIKHGLLHKSNDRKLTVSFNKSANQEHLICSIQDNGVGIAASMKINEEKSMYHKPFATKANQKRVDLLNLHRVHKIKVNTTNLYKDNKASGTKVEILIPIKNS